MRGRTRIKNTTETGFTLIETLVTITMITILTFLTVTAFPIVRANQRLQNDIYELRALFADAQQRAVNEVRDEACLERLGGNTKESVCSNVGVVLAERQFIEFADIDGNRIFSRADYEIATRNHASDIAEAGDVNLSVVFEATPPSTFTFINNDPLGPTSSRGFGLKSGVAERRLRIKQFGILEID